MDKAAIVAAIVAHLQQLLDTLAASARSARDAAISEESKPENEYDTRGLEASYLAGAQAARAEQIRAEVKQLKDLHLRAFKKADAIDVGALLEIEDEAGKKATYFLAPGRGMTVTVEGRAIQVITPVSPLGRELLGKKGGDAVEVEVRGDVREYTVLSVK